MTTQDHTTVDFVSVDEKRQRVTLTIVEERDWGERGLLLPDLQEKFNTYLTYILDGQLASDYPELAGLPVEIELRSVWPPGDREQEFLRIATRNYLQPAHISFSWKVLGNPRAPEPQPS